MEWDLAGYDSHPIDGEAASVSSLALHLGTIASDIRTQLERIRALDSSEFWVSSCGSADGFQGVVEELPEKLELVATRYENVSSALDTFHPTLASTKQDAEYWIQQAATAKDEVDRTQSGVDDMEDFEDNAEDGQEWEGENYQASHEAAEGELQTAVGNVHNAVSSFESSANDCADAIHDAGDDDLKNEGGLFGAIGRGWDNFTDGLAAAWDGFTDFLAEYIGVIDLIASVLGIASLLFGWVPIIGQILTLAALAVGVISLLAHVALAASGKGSWGDVGMAALGVVTGGAGRFVGAARNVTRARHVLGATTRLGRGGSRIMNSGFKLVSRSGRNYSGAAAGSRLNRLLGPTASRSAFRNLDGFRPMRSIRSDINMVRNGQLSEFTHLRNASGVNSRLVDIRQPGFMNNLGASGMEHLRSFTPTFGGTSMALHLTDQVAATASAGIFTHQAASA